MHLTRPYCRSWRPLLAIIIVTCVYISLCKHPWLVGGTYGDRSHPHSLASSRHPASSKFNNTLYQSSSKEIVHKEWDFGHPCRGFPDTNGVLLVMKTGASEAFEKLPTQLLTSLQCLPDFLLFSDKEQQIGPFHVHDALEFVSDTLKDHNPDFDVYRAQKDCPLSQQECSPRQKHDTASPPEAWHLDKYKFLAILERTWAMRPGKDWYVFVEADTYVVWPNMIEWLHGHLSRVEKLYVGAEALISEVPFAHGGSGFVLSGVLLQHLVERHPGVADKYNERAHATCCGDLLLGVALLEAEGVRVKDAHPMFNGNTPSTMPFGPSHWCQPVLTMHHMHAEEVSTMWQYEQTRKATGTLLMKELYHALVAPKMIPHRWDWDNLSNDICYASPDPSVQLNLDPDIKSRQKREDQKSTIQKQAHLSPEHCAMVCEGEFPDLPKDDDADEKDSGQEGAGETNPSLGIDSTRHPSALRAQLSKRERLEAQSLRRTCFQWRFHEGVCCTGRSFRLGGPKKYEPEERHSWHSGWYLQGIEEWISAMGECKTPAWRNLA